MTAFQSTSQSGQDFFALKMCGNKTNGTFLDIGSYSTVTCNNSFALEQLGWTGLMFDLIRDDENLHRRTSRFVQGDVTKLDWHKELEGMPRVIDYLSLDVDDATVAALWAIPMADYRFKVATIETDRYRLGDGPRNEIRRIMKEHGYDLVCEDVMVDYPAGCVSEYEDWFVSPELSEVANKFRCKSKHWKEIVGV